MAKEYAFNWRPAVPPELQSGALFDKYEDDSTALELNAHARLDEWGFFLHWQIDGRDAQVLDMATVWEARPAVTIPKDGRVLFELEQRGARETLDARTVWITHGPDVVNVYSVYLVAHDVETAKVWRQSINDVLRNSKTRHVCVTTNLLKHWRLLCVSVNERRKIPLKNIIRTFASGKSERTVPKCLVDLGLGGDKFIVHPHHNNNHYHKRLPGARVSLGKKIRSLYKCRTRPRRKEREELDVELFTFDKFFRLYIKICPRQDVQEVFVKLTGQKEYLTRERLIQFLNEEQRDPRLNEILFPFFDRDRAQQIIAKYETDEKYIQEGKMSGDAFLRYLMSDENAPVFLDRIDLHQDMDQPLPHYYVNSSHNTYLTGRQYGGKSSAEIYRQVLLSGCRCIELDCWDGTGDNKGEPIITHGKAMCTDVFFRDVLVQIKDTAFARSDWPVILSFENHCSRPNQLKMARYCVEIFGDMLLSKPLEDFALEPGVPLPSPNRLKRKILIKVLDFLISQIRNALQNKRLKADIEKHQLEQFLREGKLDEEEDTATETAEATESGATGNATSAATPIANAPSGQPSSAAAVGVNGHDEDDGATPSVSSESSEEEEAHGVQGASNVSPRIPPPPPEVVVLVQDEVENNKPETSEARSNQLLPNAAQQQLQIMLPSADAILVRTASARHALGAAWSKSKQSLRQAVSMRRRPGQQQQPQPQQPHQQNQLNTSLGGSLSARGDLPIVGSLKTEDEAHPELKQPNFITKLRPLAFANKKVLTKEEEERIFAEYHYDGATTNIHPLLSSLINYTHPVKFAGFETAEANNMCFHMSSFSESTGLGYLRQNAVEFVNYNKRQLSRIYPKGARVDSSNFLPQVFWNAGCQMVSLNFQTPDVGMQLNQGKFEYNANSGYLLKPGFMRRPDRVFDPFSESPMDGVIAAHCSIRVISGHFLCERKIGTYVEVEMYGLPTDTIRKEHRTRMVPANGLNPVYNETPFIFRKVILPDLAVLRFAVFDENGKQIGQRILPLDGLQAGYRHIPLRTESSLPIIPASLFVHIVIKTYVPEELSGLVDALADPMAWNRRMEGLKKMGIDEADLDLPSSSAARPGSAKVGPPRGGTPSSSIPPAAAAAATTTSISGIGQPGTSGLCSTAGSSANLNNHMTETKQPNGDNNNGYTPTSTPRQEPPVTSRSMAGGGGGGGGAGGGNSAATSAAALDAEKYKVEVIDVAALRREKSFHKLQKRLTKDLDELRKKHHKQRESIHKHQQSTVDKMLSSTHKSMRKKEKPTVVSNPSPVDNHCDEQIRSLVVTQTDELAALVKKQMLEEHELRLQHVNDEFDCVKKLLLEAQKTQMAALRAKLEAESRELRQAQTKKSMDDARAITASSSADKSAKAKAERERRVKELNEKNLKQFVEERKRLAMKAERHEEQLRLRHEHQLAEVEAERKKVTEQEEMNLKEEELAQQRPSSIV